MAKLVKCKHCGARIAATAKTCPQCGGENTPPKPGQQITAPKNNISSERGVFMSGLIGVLTSVKNIQINYTVQK